MTETTATGRAQVTLPTDTQILIPREFDAPPELVWRAFTDAELVKRWWGGLRGNVTHTEIDLRVGGRWRFVMTAASPGDEVAFHGTYRLIDAPNHLVSSEVYEGVPGAVDDESAAVNDATFVALDSGARTRFELLCEYHTREVRDIVIDSGMEVGMQESYDALEQVARELQ
jgi:uncharacterized protein YndB with AHSA1/START domain